MRTPGIVVAIAAATVVAVPLGYLAGTRLAPPGTPSAAGAIVRSVDVAASRAGACGPGNLLDEGPSVLFVGIHASGLPGGAPLTVAITGPYGTVTATATAHAPDRSGCTVVSLPARVDHGGLWSSGDYAIAIELGAPPTPAGPVTAFSIAAGITDD